MHEHALATKIVELAREAAKGQEIESIEIEVGKLASITAPELIEALKAHVAWRVNAKPVAAAVACTRCGFKGKPKIIAREHDLVIYCCPKCGEVPSILKGGDVILRKVKTK